MIRIQIETRVGREHIIRAAEFVLDTHQPLTRKTVMRELRLLVETVGKHALVDREKPVKREAAEWVDRIFPQLKPVKELRAC